MLTDQHELMYAVKHLEPLPPTVARLAALLSRTDWEIEEVLECIRFDQVLTPKLLRVANSALWFRGHPISNVRDAVMRMGSGAVVAFAMGTGVQRRFSRALPHYGLLEGELWRHAVAAAISTSVLDARTDAEVPVEAFTSALLHDLGKLVISRVLDQKPAEAEHHRFANLQERRTTDAEVEVLGLDHAALGAVAAVHWQLPERIGTGICFHHSPGAASDPIASVVHVADAIAHRAQAAAARRRPEVGAALVDADVLQRLSLREAQLDRLAGEVGEQLDDVARRFA
jgi:HD-like signal output (HDOD) protein